MEFLVKFFTHEVSDLEPTFYFLVALNPGDFKAWETRYVLLIWLSLICIIPFDLKTVDSRASENESNKVNWLNTINSITCIYWFILTNLINLNDQFPLVDHIIGLSKYYLNVTGKERDAAAVLLSRLLTRFEKS